MRGFHGAPDDEGFVGWSWSEQQGGFLEIFGAVRGRGEPDGRVRLRVETGPSKRNGSDVLHGGFIMAFADLAVFLGPIFQERLFARSVTLTLATSFIAAGRIDMPLDALIETVAETGRTLFVRGLMVQGDTTIASFDATLRKLSQERAAAARGT